ncbi:DNA-directed DNA polymerase [Synchytrium endobioticum]|uniref:DNA-directed DNA polymerase n=1 Tax=Synchytrium endobioticum TaxID=286115 RepID=A0A507DC08_9FUNG|nr:DNA-directed DNA polymerase [Synchytrium endobioticum]
MKILRSDNGGEYKNGVVEDYVNENGITHQFTIPGNPSQNGIAESLWPEMVNHANTIRNFCPTRTTGRSPYEAYHGRSPPLDKLYTFGAIVIVHKDGIEPHSKLESNGVLGVYLGFALMSKGLRIWIPTTNKIIERTKVRIDETRVFKDVEWGSSHVEQSRDDFEIKYPVVQTPMPNEENIDVPTNTLDPGEGNQEVIAGPPINNDHITHDDSEPGYEDEFDKYNYKSSPAGTDFVPIVRPRIGAAGRQRDIQRMKERQQSLYIAEGMERYGELGLTKEVDPDVPKGYSEAIESGEWIKAMEIEATSFREHGVFEIVDRVHGIRTIPGKWIYCRKNLVNGASIAKARFVAMGFRQREGIEYNWTYSPTTMSTSLRMLLTIIAKEDLDCDQLDVSTAFLHGRLQEDIYMEIPLGFGMNPDSRKVVKLKKAIYGLKQAGREWNNMMNHRLKEIGFIPLVMDPTVYQLLENNEVLYLILYVDDILIASRSRSSMERVKEMLRAIVKLKDLGPVKTFIGIEVKRDRSKRVIGLGQSRNQGAIGAIMWITNNTRPDVAARVGIKAQMVASPTLDDWFDLMKLGRELFETKDEVLRLGGEDELIPETFLDKVLSER